MTDTSRPNGPIWKSAGLHLVERNAAGWLKVTPDLLRAYFTRPEIHPVEESCDAEHRLFEKLMAEPFAAVTQQDLAAIRDGDAAENYRIIIAFRDHLARHGTIEGAYAALFRGAAITMPPVFIDQMVHLIMAGLLDAETDAFHAKAGELFFRDQKVTTDGGQLMLADAEVVEMRRETGGFGGLGSLLMEAGTPMREVSLDILTDDNAASYWARADLFDFALDFRFTQRGPDALAYVIGQWVRHFNQIEVRVQAMQSIHDERWTWHVGLDSEATRILNALYAGETPDDAELARIAGLFRMEVLDDSEIDDAMRGKPVYLGLAMRSDHSLKMKPQNLLTNLPFKKRQ
jgi:hypothetical protein